MLLRATTSLVLANYQMTFTHHNHFNFINKVNRHCLVVIHDLTDFDIQRRIEICMKLLKMNGFSNGLSLVMRIRSIFESLIAGVNG